MLEAGRGMKLIEQEENGQKRVASMVETQNGSERGTREGLTSKKQE